MFVCRRRGCVCGWGGGVVAMIVTRYVSECCRMRQKLGNTVTRARGVCVCVLCVCVRASERSRAHARVRICVCVQRPKDGGCCACRVRR